MDKKVIVYGSRYGTTERYARALAELTGIEAVPYDAAGDLSAYDTIIYFGGLYAGGVLGLAKTVGQLAQAKHLIIVTVGLADPMDKTNTDHIKASLQKQLPPELYTRAEFFHLRGGIDYSHLSLKHKAMMKLLYEKVKKLPPEQQTAETRAMIDTYGQVVDFADLSALDAIMQVL